MGAIARASPVIEVSGLSKRYERVQALDRLDLSVDRGEVLGLLGPNGAGKTTTLRLLLGLINADEGSVTVLGGRPGAADVLARVGALIEEPALYPYLSGRDHLRALARYTGADERLIDPALSDMGLTDAADAKTRTYSLGMRQRLAIAGALIKRPELLILDEPTNGLDPAGISTMREWIRSYAASGRTVILSSHLLGEVEHICDRVAVLFEGRKVADGTVAELQPEEAVMIAADPPDRALSLLEQHPQVLAAIIRDGRIRAVIAPGAAAEVNTALVSAGIRIFELWPAQRSLEEIFFGLTQPRGAEP
ncbi:MAG TPA: ATP-binding cassette domain-containing protein [Egibacteraceae bacterium]|nr:ATP-binding cassette domain-containing protein [Egibacteraceae bacterium]